MQCVAGAKRANRDGRRSSAQYGPDAGELALRRQDPLRPAVSCPSREWKTALPHARRRPRLRGATRQPECPENRVLYTRVAGGVAAHYGIHPRHTITDQADQVIIISAIARACLAPAQRTNDPVLGLIHIGPTGPERVDDDIRADLHLIQFYRLRTHRARTRYAP